MIISMIAALADNGVIGIDNRLPWRIPDDLQYFKAQTLGKPILMGRKTFESFGARPLPGRQNIILTRDPDYSADGITVVHSLDEALSAAAGAEELMVIGGAQLYAQMLERAQRLYLTYVHASIEGDARFPDFDSGQWRQVRREDHQANERNSHDFSFVLLERL